MEKNKNLTIFIVCLVISSLIWISMSMSRSYSVNYNFPVVFNNVPINKRIKNKDISIKSKITATGWDLLTKNIKSRKIFIDLDDYPREKALNFSNTKSLINENYSDLKILETVPSFFTINFEELLSKKVAIKLNIEYDLPDNFYLSKEPKTYPDSIEISSSKEILDKIEYIETEKIIVSKNDSIKKNIKLLSIENVRFNKKIINAKFNIEEFAELEYLVPINIENKPKDVDLVFYPEKIKLKCLVPFSEYKKIMPSDFYISVDFNNIELSKDNTAFISIKEKPKSARNIQLEKDKIEFIKYSNK